MEMASPGTNIAAVGWQPQVTTETALPGQELGAQSSHLSPSVPAGEAKPTCSQHGSTAAVSACPTWLPAARETQYTVSKDFFPLKLRGLSPVFVNQFSSNLPICPAYHCMFPRYQSQGPTHIPAQSNPLCFILTVNTRI